MASRRKTQAQKRRAEKNRRKTLSMGKPGEASLYARKKAYLTRHGGFGFEYPSKPWK